MCARKWPELGAGGRARYLPRVPASWKVIALAPRAVIEAALLAHEELLDWDPELVLAGSEVAEDRPDDWRLEAWLPREPTPSDRAAIAALFAGEPPAFTIEPLPDRDWVAESQRPLEPIRAGRFHVRTPDHPPRDEPGVTDFAIPASRAFGTGHHATTAGCLAMLTEMKRRGTIVRNMADIGTGPGLLGFAALDLWPGALATASDIDAICLSVLEENARLNGVRLGARAGELTITVADGMDHPLLAARGPYDLIAANILAGPLIQLAPRFAGALATGGSLLLAGLLATQEAPLRAAYRRAGFRLAARTLHGDWSILWLRKRLAADLRPRLSRPPRGQTGG
jgi:ribosomal protein L11 methyltransferase